MPVLKHFLLLWQYVMPYPRQIALSEYNEIVACKCVGKKAKINWSSKGFSILNTEQIILKLLFGNAFYLERGKICSLVKG